MSSSNALWRLRRLSQSTTAAKPASLRVGQLTSGMVLSRPVLNQSGAPLLVAGTELTEGLIERLIAYDRNHNGERLEVFIEEGAETA